jgi:hypothetical protein
MQLNPKLPPGHAGRKALRYACEMHRLRAEGHTLESIRLALLDAGISVSLSTVRREVARPPSQWELEHAHSTPSVLDETQPDTATSVMTRSPAPLEASCALQDSPADGGPSPARIDAGGNRRTFGLFSKVITILHRLCRARRIQ